MCKFIQSSYILVFLNKQYKMNCILLRTELHASRFKCQSTNFQDDGIGRWDLWEVVRVRWSHDEINALIKRKCFCSHSPLFSHSFSLSYEDTVRWQPSPRWCHKNSTMLVPSQTSGLPNGKKKKFLLLKQPWLWYLVMAAQAETLWLLSQSLCLLSPKVLT